MHCIELYGRKGDPAGARYIGVSALVGWVEFFTRPNIPSRIVVVGSRSFTQPTRSRRSSCPTHSGSFGISSYSRTIHCNCRARPSRRMMSAANRALRLSTQRSTGLMWISSTPPAKIGVIADSMFPEPALPHGLLALGPPAFAPIKVPVRLERKRG